MLLDTDVMVDVLRGHPPAVAWLTGYSASIGLPGLVAMELLQGCRDQNDQNTVETELRRFALHWPKAIDCDRALADFATFRLSHNLGLLDSLIAHTAVGIGEELATFNLKHYSIVKGLKTVQPY